MKKKYVSPLARLIDVANDLILARSGNRLGVNNKTTESMLTKRHSSWDDDDEEEE